MSVCKNERGSLITDPGFITNLMEYYVDGVRFVNSNLGITDDNLQECIIDYWRKEILTQLQCQLYEIQMGNRIYLSTIEDLQARKKHFLSAKRSCGMLIAQLEIILLFANTHTTTIEQFIVKLNHEIKLLSGIIKSDAKRIN